MAMGRPKAALVLDAELREQLESLANSRALPAGLVRRAKIILLSASGKDRPGNCAASRDEPEHREPVASAFLNTRGLRAL